MTVYAREKKLILMSTRNSSPVNVINTMCEADCKGDLELYVINKYVKGVFRTPVKNLRGSVSR